MISQCVVCRSDRDLPLVFSKNGIPIHVCSACQSILADVSHPAFEATDYEREDYYTMSFDSPEEIDLQWGLRWRHVLDRIQSRMRGDTILDVGAGNGYFVKLAGSERSLRATGLEPSERQTEFAREVLGVELRAEMLQDHDEKDYSALTLFNVIEHVIDPEALLVECRDHLAVDGILVVTTPNPGCLRARAMGLESWPMVFPPHHTNLFSRRGLDTILERAGFEPIHYDTLSTYLRSLRRYGGNSSHVRRFVFNLLRWSGLGADHFVVARARPR